MVRAKEVQEDAVVHAQFSVALVGFAPHTIGRLRILLQLRWNARNVSQQTQTGCPIRYAEPTRSKTRKRRTTRCRKPERAHGPIERVCFQPREPLQGRRFLCQQLVGEDLRHALVVTASSGPARPFARRGATGRTCAITSLFIQKVQHDVIHTHEPERVLFLFELQPGCMRDLDCGRHKWLTTPAAQRAKWDATMRSPCTTGSKAYFFTSFDCALHR